jgi:hypothetical protein
MAVDARGSVALAGPHSLARRPLRLFPQSGRIPRGIRLLAGGAFMRGLLPAFLLEEGLTSLGSERYLLAKKSREAANPDSS